MDYQSRYNFICRAIAKDNEAQTISTTLNNNLNQLSHYLSNDLAELARRGSPDNFTDIFTELQTEMGRFREFCEFPDLAQKVVIGIGGKFSAGKSTLINTLLGKKQLVTEIDPTTSLPTYLLQGNEPSVTALNLFNKKVNLSMQEFQTLTHDEKQNYGSQIGSLLTSAFITDPEFQWQNLALLDTPGYTKPEDNDHSARTDETVARSQLNAAQFIVWLVSAEDGTIKEDDLLFLASLNSDIPRLVLINKSDTKTPDDVANIVALVKKTLADRNLPALDVIPVSRKKRDYPIEPVLAWFDKWNEYPRELIFTRNFEKLFTYYGDYIKSEMNEIKETLSAFNQLSTLYEINNSKEYKLISSNLIQRISKWQNALEDFEKICKNFYNCFNKIHGLMGFNAFEDYNQEFELPDVNSSGERFEKILDGTNKISQNLESAIAKSEVIELRKKLAENINISFENQILLSCDKNKTIILSLAKNPNLSLKAQKILASKEDSDINRLLARNSNLYLEIQLKLAESKDLWVRRWLARNQNTSLEVQLLLAKDNNFWVRIDLAENIKIFLVCQSILANDEDEKVRINLSRNIGLMKEIQEILVYDLNFKVRRELAKNLNIDDSIQFKLSKDLNYEVREELFKNSKLNREIKYSLSQEFNV